MTGNILNKANTINTYSMIVTKKNFPENERFSDVDAVRLEFAAYDGRVEYKTVKELMQKLLKYREQLMLLEEILEKNSATTEISGVKFKIIQQKLIFKD